MGKTSSIIPECQAHGTGIHLKTRDEKLASLHGNVAMQSTGKDFF